MDAVGPAVPLSPEAGLALYQATQEAVSNVRQHAGNAEVDVTLVWADQVELTVADTGDVPATSLGGSGCSPHHVTGVSIPVASGVDGAGAVLAGYPGFVVDLSYSKITTSTLPSEIQGEDATLLVDHVASPRTLTLQHRDGRIEQRVLNEPQHTLVDEVRRFVDLIQTGSDPTNDHEKTRQTLQVMDAIESMSGDSVIDLADPSS